MTEVGNVTNELLQALVSAPDKRKVAALKALRGEDESPQPRRAEPEPFLTLRELSRRLNLAACTLWRWQVPGHGLAGRRRFRLSEVDTYLKSPEFEKRAQELRDGRRGLRTETGAGLCTPRVEEA